MIGVVGDLDDLSARYLGWLAERRGMEVLLLSEERLGIDWWFRLQPDGDGSITVGGREIAFAEIDGMAVRLNPTPSIDAALAIEIDAEPVYALERRHGLHWLLNAAPFRVVNRPWAGRSNGSKALQMALLSDCGLEVPEWIVTTRAERARDFVRRWPDGAVYKAVSGLRSHVRRADDELFARLGAGTTPVVIQRYIAGVDVRVHTIDGAIFATEVSSPAIDYRFATTSPDYRPVEVPASVAELCRVAAAREGLALAGFDFRHDPAGRWWCLEMNPVPTFLPYEAATRHPIGDAIVDYLAGLAPRRAGLSPLAAVAEAVAV